MPIVDDESERCPACGKANCKSSHSRPLDPKRVVPHIDKEEQGPESRKDIQGPERTKPALPNRKKEADPRRFAAPPPDTKDEA